MHVHLRCLGPLESGPFVQRENQRSLNQRHQSRIWFSLMYQYQGCLSLHSNCQKGATPPGAWFSRPGLNQLSHSLRLRFLLMVPKLNAEIERKKHTYSSQWDMLEKLGGRGNQTKSNFLCVFFNPGRPAKTTFSLINSANWVLPMFPLGHRWSKLRFCPLTPHGLVWDTNKKISIYNTK